LGERERRGSSAGNDPGVGPTIASALVAAIGQAESFDRGRNLAAWLGLVPRQFTTGGRPKLLDISKRGNKYLRKLLIRGARAALPYVAKRDTPLGRWAKGLLGRAHHNVAVVAFAAKDSAYVHLSIWSSHLNLV
jgi:transposase